MALVTADEARRHLQITASGLDADTTAVVALMMESASEIVLDYVDDPEVTWTAEDVPALIKAAVLMVLADLFHNREEGGLTDGVKRILRRYRDPALA